MSEQIATSSSSFSNFLSIIGIIISIFTIFGSIIASYAFFIVRSLNSKMIELKENLKEDILETKREIEKSMAMHEEHYAQHNRNVRDLVELQANFKNLKDFHDKVHQ